MKIQKSVFRHIITLVLTIVISTVCTLPAYAVKFNENYSLSGSSADKMVTIATAQLGRNGINLGYKNSEGKGDAWCAKFVSDVAKKAGESTAIPYNGGCRQLYNAIIKAGGKEVSSPQKGDIVFFVCTKCKFGSHNNSFEHTGIMSGNGTLYISGNSGGGAGTVLNKTTTSYLHYNPTHKVSTGAIAVKYVRPAYKNSSTNSDTSDNPQYFDCNVQIDWSTGKDVYLYNNPGDSQTVDYFSTGQSLVSKRGAKLSDGTTWYEITARKKDTGKIRDFWLKYDSSRMILKDLSNSEPKPDNVTLTLSKSSFELKPGEQATLNFSFTGNIGYPEVQPDGSGALTDISGSWNADKRSGRATFTAATAGTGSISINLFDKNGNLIISKSASITVSVPETTPAKKPATLTFSPSSLSLDLTNQKSQEVTLTLGGDFSWGDKLYRSVSNPDVVTVDWSNYESGAVFCPVITAKTAGETTLTCSVVDKATGTTRATAQLKITVTPANYTVRYDANGGTNAPTSQSKIAKQDLTLTSDCPKREGFTFAGWAASRNGSVQYQPGDSFTTDKDVTLYAIWEAKNQVSLTLANEAFTVKPGKQATLNFTFTGNISSVDYEIKDTSICEYVDGEWKQSQHRGTLIFRALSSGTTDITIKLFDKTGKVLDSQSASVTVETPQSNASIELSESNINFSSPGETQEIRAITTPSGQEITWSKKIIETLPIPDRNPSAFTMRNTGGEINRIRATEAGIAEVIASMTYAGNTYTASCTVMTPGIYVSALDTTVVKDGDRKIMNIGTTEQFSVYTIPLNRAVRWGSSDPSVATVSNNGAVTAVGSGFAEIRATIDVNGTTYSDSCYVAVPENSSNTGVVYFDTLYPFASDRYTGNEGDSFIDVIGRRNGNVDVNGNSYEHGLTAWIARWNYTAESSWVWNQYSLGGNYKTLTGKVVLIKSYNESNFDTQLTITGDGIPLYSKRLTPDSLPTEEFQINVAGINTLKIELSDNTSVRGGTAFGLANLSLQ